MSVAAVGALVGSTGAGAAAAGATIVGSVISGVAGAFLSKKEREEEEKSRIAEENRREERFRGIGEATRIDEQEPEKDHLDRRQREAAPVGARAPRIGEQYRSDDIRRTGSRGLGDPGEDRTDVKTTMPQTTAQIGATPSIPQDAVNQQVQRANMAAAPKKSRYAYNPAKNRIEMTG